MTQPVTELDTQFSDQDAVATDWNETRRALEVSGLDRHFVVHDTVAEALEAAR